MSRAYLQPKRLLIRIITIPSIFHSPQPFINTAPNIHQPTDTSVRNRITPKK